MSFKRTKSFFLSFFRGLFLYHHTSLEYRAKLFAAMIASNTDDNSCEYDILKKIAKEIYNEDEYREDALVHTTKEYVDKIVKNNLLDIDHLLLDIDKEGKINKRFIEKINMEHLRSFYCPDSSEAIVILQTRILEFFENQMKTKILKTF